MDPLDQQLSDYASLKSWLRGDKPPALGRTRFRRAVQVVAQMPVAAVRVAVEHPGGICATVGVAGLMAGMYYLIPFVMIKGGIAGMKALFGSEALMTGTPIDGLMVVMLPYMESHVLLLAALLPLVCMALRYILRG